jgi:hypothetical protein
METDIMAEYKRNRFVVAPHYLLENVNQHVVILSDLAYWTNHYDELREWCELHGGEVAGMGVTLPDAHTVTLFSLRWS